MLKKGLYKIETIFEKDGICFFTLAEYKGYLYEQENASKYNIIPLKNFICVEEREKDGCYLLTKNNIYRIFNTLPELHAIRLPAGFRWESFCYKGRDILDNHGVPMGAINLYRLEIINTDEENRKKLLANPELLLEKLKAAAENADNFMWKDWNC